MNAATITESAITSDKIASSVPRETIPAESITHQTSVALVANSSNWRKVVRDLIGDEPVTYEERSKKDSLRKFPIVNIFSTDKEALDRVLTKAAEVE